MFTSPAKHLLAPLWATVANAADTASERSSYETTFDNHKNMDERLNERSITFDRITTINSTPSRPLSIPAVSCIPHLRSVLYRVADKLYPLNLYLSKYRLFSSREGIDVAGVIKNGAVSFSEPLYTRHPITLPRHNHKAGAIMEHSRRALGGEFSF